MATDPTTSGGDPKVTFTPEQQARIDEIIREAQGRAGKEARTELENLKTQMQTMQSELQTAKEALKNAKTPQQKSEAQDDIAALQNQINEMKAAGTSTQQELERLRQAAASKDKEVSAAREEAKQIRKEVAMQKAASKVNFVNIGVVTKLTGDNIRWDDTRNTFIVVNEHGTERLNAAYEPMSLDEFYTEFAAQNPYLVRGDVKGGAGSTESQRSGLSSNGKYTVEQIFGKKSVGALANKLNKEDPKEYARLKAIALENNLI
jgi:hypothetical protein